jgi:hypothetical protein
LHDPSIPAFALPAALTQPFGQCFCDGDAGFAAADIEIRHPTADQVRPLADLGLIRTEIFEWFDHDLDRFRLARGNRRYHRLRLHIHEYHLPCPAAPERKSHRRRNTDPPRKLHPLCNHTVLPPKK